MPASMIAATAPRTRVELATKILRLFALFLTTSGRDIVYRFLFLTLYRLIITYGKNKRKHFFYKKIQSVKNTTARVVFLVVRFYADFLSRSISLSEKVPKIIEVKISPR